MRVRKVRTSGTKGVGWGIRGVGAFRRWAWRQWLQVKLLKDVGSESSGRLSVIVVDGGDELRRDFDVVSMD